MGLKAMGFTCRQTDAQRLVEWLEKHREEPDQKLTIAHAALALNRGRRYIHSIAEELEGNGKIAICVAFQIGNSGLHKFDRVGDYILELI
jgi:hypothetical protein